MSRWNVRHSLALTRHRRFLQWPWLKTRRTPATYFFDITSTLSELPCGRSTWQISPWIVSTPHWQTRAYKLIIKRIPPKEYLILPQIKQPIARALFWFIPGLAHVGTIDIDELCPKGIVLPKALRECLRGSLRAACAPAVLAYARE